MQITGQNNAYIPQYHCYGNGVPFTADNGYTNPNSNNPLQNEINRGINQTPNPASAGANPAPTCYSPQITVPPNASGVNIQIFNPSVATPGSQSHSNVNAPNYYYPPNYYTGQIGGQNNGGNGNNNGTDTSNNSNSSTSSTQTDTNSTNKSEKKHIVVLDDNYIKNLESMLNSKDKADRINAAKQVFERLDEDPSRKDDKALTALVNKMLQDPVQEVRLLALSALEGRICNGDQLTVQLLEQMRTNPKDYGFDANDASRILLDMSGQRADKDVPVDPDKRTKIKTEEKKDDKKKSQIKSNNKPE